MTHQRLTKLMKLVRDSNTGYLLVSGGGEGFLELDLMYRIVEETTADITWMVTAAHWAKDKNRALKIIEEMYKAFLRGKHNQYNRKIYLRVSFDTEHIEKIGGKDDDQFSYIINIIKIFEEKYSSEVNFCLLLHSLEGEGKLIDKLCKKISGIKSVCHDSIHEYEKITESAFKIKLNSGYQFEITFAKVLLSDLSADLRDRETLKKRINVFEKDAFCNEKGNAGIMLNSDGTIGPDMLVIYNGRVAGGWQSEMPDVSINLDNDDFDSIMQKTLSDPGVLGTIETGIKYRFNIINEVNQKAVIRAKAVNVRDYTSPVLLEEDTVKLYYSVRVMQDYLSKNYINKDEIERWPLEIRWLVDLKKSELIDLYNTSKYDIIQQFINTDRSNLFNEFVNFVKKFIETRENEIIISFFNEHDTITKRTIDKWRLLLKRIVNGWYDLYTFNHEDINALNEIERILDRDILDGKRIYEGLSLNDTEKLL